MSGETGSVSVEAIASSPGCSVNLLWLCLKMGSSPFANRPISEFLFKVQNWTPSRGKMVFEDIPSKISKSYLRPPTTTPSQCYQPQATCSSHTHPEATKSKVFQNDSCRGSFSKPHQSKPLEPNHNGVINKIGWFS